MDPSRHDVPIPVARRAGVGEPPNQVVGVEPLEGLHLLRGVGAFDAHDAAPLVSQTSRQPSSSNANTPRNVSTSGASMMEPTWGAVRIATVPAFAQAQLGDVQSSFEDLLATGRDIAQDAVRQPAGFARQRHDAEGADIVPTVDRFMKRLRFQAGELPYKVRKLVRHMRGANPPETHEKPQKTSSFCTTGLSDALPVLGGGREDQCSASTLGWLSENSWQNARD